MSFFFVFFFFLITHRFTALPILISDLISKYKQYTAYTGTVSQAWLYKHAAHTGPAYDRLVQHLLQVVEVALTDDSTLAIFFYMRYR